MGRSKNKEISTALYKKLAPLLPVVAPSPRVDGPSQSDEQALNDIVFGLRTGILWDDLPRGMGLAAA